MCGPNLYDLVANIDRSLSHLARPSVVMKPSLFYDKNRHSRKWTCYFGTPIISEYQAECKEEFVAGYGNTPEEAMQDFDKAWFKCP